MTIIIPFLNRVRRRVIVVCVAQIEVDLIIPFRQTLEDEMRCSHTEVEVSIVPESELALQKINIIMAIVVN